MTPISNKTVETFLAFGTASIAVCQVKELARRHRLDDRTPEHLAELEAAHVRLRELFAEGSADRVHDQASVVVDLAARTDTALGEEWTSPVT